MSAETDAFLESVRRAEDPTPADERRVLGRVHAAVAAGALIGTAAATSKWVRVWTWSAGGGLKGGAAIVVLVAAALGGVAALTGVFTPNATPLQVRGGVVTKLTPVAQPAPLTTPERIAPPAPLTRPAPVAKPDPAPKPKPGLVAASLRDELAVLARAQAALRRGDAPEALRALDGVSTRPPQLAAERATLRILALCGVGRPAEARRVAAALERSEPGSLQRDVISRSCAGNKTSPQR